MKHLSDDDLDFDRMVAEMLPAESGFFFDDEPLDDVLYAKGGKGPTSASLFSRSREYIIKLHSARQKGDTQAVIDTAAMLASEECPISLGSCIEIAAIMKSIVPQVPNPIMKYDLVPLRPLLERVWQIAAEKQDMILQKAISAALYRWYEHYRYYDKARDILDRLIEIYIQEENRSEQAVATNNRAFEFFLEGRFREALPGFMEAADLFDEIGQKDQCANSRANYWTCRFELGDLGDLDGAKAEFMRLAKILEFSGLWQARKPIALLARIAERQGEIHKAIALTKKAITACAQSRTRYPDMDREYLKHLEQRLSRESGLCQ